MKRIALVLLLGLSACGKSTVEVEDRIALQFYIKREKVDCVRTSGGDGCDMRNAAWVCAALEPKRKFVCYSLSGDLSCEEVVANVEVSQ